MSSGFTFDRSVPDALLAPEPTGNKRVRAHAKAKAEGRMQHLTDFILPPLDVAAMQHKYGADRAQAPRLFQATFVAKIDTPRSLFEKLAKDRIGRWISIMTKKGWDLASDVHVRPGVYPARHIDTNIPFLDEREFIISASFCFRSPKPVRIELPRDWLEPVRIGRN